ncbi:hypothetical protein V2J09_023901 [Rumex salicifolius]
MEEWSASLGELPGKPEEMIRYVVHKMDRRSWPWKKKSSEKSAAEKAIATLDAAGVASASGGSQNEKDNYKKPNYVQISVESYEHLTGLEDQVKSYEDQVKTYKEQVKTYEEQVKTYEDQLKTLDEQIDELNENLSAAHTEMNEKEELVKQHAKVAEEAVSGWEKAEAEAATLKTHLEAVTLSKLTAEDRAAHLDNALKECMRQIRNLKEEHEKKVQDVVLTKNLQYDKMKREFEAKIGQLDQEILRAEAENDAVSRSLQERSTKLIKMTAEKSEAEADIELLKSNLEACEREINSLKYEVHIVSKELEIRNEEKNMSAKTAEVANKQHMEGVKKIAKLEAECQRLRGLVKKKLPGPAAFAQMKLEVESLGREYGETRRRSPVKPASPHLSPHPRTPVTEFSMDGSQKLLKENEFLTERLLAMEEETKMLKEALSKRNSELQSSRSMYAKTANKLQSLEAQLNSGGKQKGSAEFSSIQNASDPPSLTSLSEDGNDDAASVAESWGSALISEVSMMKDKNKDKSSRTDSTNHLELMDDFLEMEKFARSSNDSNVDKKRPETVNHEANVANGAEGQTEKQPEVNSLFKAENTTPDAEPSLLRKVRLRISKVLESVSNDADIGKTLEEIKCIVQETIDTLHPHPVTCVFVEKHCSEDAVATSDKEVSLLENGKQSVQKEKLSSKELEAAISEIHTFVLSLGKEAAALQGKSDDVDGLERKIDLFSSTCDKVLCNEMNLSDIVVSLSNVVVKVGDISFNLMGYKGCETEPSTPDCIDKVALPENKEAQEERYPNGCSHVSDSSSNPEFPSEANILQGVDSASCKCSLEFEQLKAEKDNMDQELARSMEDLVNTKSHMKETEQMLAEVKSQLASAQKTNSLAETQLKCMAESYKSLEKRAEELETEINLLHSKMESLEIELQAEKHSHQDALARCNDLEEQVKRNEECSMCSSLAADLENKNKQEKELQAAAQKLAECQETIFLLGRQLKGFRPPQNERDHHHQELLEEEPITSGMNGQDLIGNESPVDLHTTPFSSSDTEANAPERSAAMFTTPKHRPTKSGSSSASSTPTPEKHSRDSFRLKESLAIEVIL